MAYLGNPEGTIAVLQKYQFRFQKKYGQNFLIDEHVIRKILNAAGISKEDTVLEIGPGIGTLTQYLCESAGKVIAVEIDRNLVPILENDVVFIQDLDRILGICKICHIINLLRFYIEKNLHAFSKVIRSTSSSEMPFISDNFATTPLR